MPPNYKRLQEKITFEDLMGTLSEEFAQVEDHRRANSSYELADVLRSVSFAKTRFICVFNNFACLSPSQKFRDQNLILAQWDR